ncbi:N-acetylglucosamine kinase [Arthrobacter glacialis]|uniref:N-acetylglucosamine kinase n=1 Tax=Arthrobacter glacialis TaxID=1664 RepID=UPI0013FE48CC|nr:BadF/BadG/BcrA/BcrD ATPase family protein [Arthrobacter glacialis]
MNPAPVDMMEAVVAVDGGNSKTDVAVVRLDGTVLSVSRSAGYRPQKLGNDKAAQGLRALILEGIKAAGSPRILHLGVYVANADYPAEEAELQQRIVGWDLAQTVGVGNDTLALLRSGSTERFGVAVVCGAGINCVGVGRNGEVARFAAIGRMSGDWGGGLDLALEIMFHATRAEDGRGPATVLSGMVSSHFGLSSALEVAQAIHLGLVDQSRLHELVPLLFPAAERGDSLAADLVSRQADEVVALASAALHRTGLADTHATVVLGGGVLSARAPALNNTISERLATSHPLAHTIVPDQPPLFGSILLAFDKVPLSREERHLATERVSKTLRPTQLTNAANTRAASS